MSDRLLLGNCVGGFSGQVVNMKPVRFGALFGRNNGGTIKLVAMHFQRLRDLTDRVAFDTQRDGVGSPGYGAAPGLGAPSTASASLNWHSPSSRNGARRSK